MEIGIVGRALSGKTTLFNLLTGNSEKTGLAGGRGTSHTGIARVPDDRLVKLAELFHPKKTTPATVQYVDVPALPDAHGHEGAMNLAQLRTMDALMVVLRAFENAEAPHPAGSIDPVRDLVHVEEEFLLQDQMVVERRLERLEKDLKKRRAPELEAEKEVLERCLASLEEGRPLRDAGLDEAARKLLRGFTFLSLKPLLAVVNLDESRVGEDPFSEPRWADLVKRPQTAYTSVCATLEGELAEMDPADAAELMEEMGLADRALDRIIHASYELLGLISFFTVGEDECRAWPIRRGTTALEAAGVIHTDIQRGFIRAETVRWDELLDAGSMAFCRQRGTLRLEGKTYIAQDGDVMHFRFNI
ncbi:MAG: redox-regulated ATPase YchF [Acidobacteria bacterium]|nr:redox-regulated ATPase YchF [Acidobacteriota bacterium]